MLSNRCETQIMSQFIFFHKNQAVKTIFFPCFILASKYTDRFFVTDFLSYMVISRALVLLLQRTQELFGSFRLNPPISSLVWILITNKCSSSPLESPLNNIDSDLLCTNLLIFKLILRKCYYLCDGFRNKWTSVEIVIHYRDMTMNLRQNIILFKYQTLQFEFLLFFIVLKMKKNLTLTYLRHFYSSISYSSRSSNLSARLAYFGGG